MTDSAAPATPSKAPLLVERLVALLLVVYLLAVGLGASQCILQTFPAAGVSDQLQVSCVLPGATFTASGERVLLLVAFFAGVVGSFLHAAQSLATYIGNDDFKMSWAAWYILRPWIGGILGFALYFIARAGLVGGVAADNVNAYGVVAIGMLGGWFSKTTTDKLQEVFSTLFKTEADKERKDKLTVAGQPVVTAVTPSPVPATATELAVAGTAFADGVIVTVGQTLLDATFVSPKSLIVSLAKLTPRPTGEAELVVKNPAGPRPAASPFKITFEA